MFSPFELASHKDLRSYILDNTYDPWVGTPFEGYVFLGSKKQGAYGERFIAHALANTYTLEVQKPLNTGHDRLINDIKCEFKFTLASRDCVKRIINVDGFSINHVALKKDWERLVICAINPSDHQSHLVYITKEDFISEMQLSEPVFKSQQGGDTSNNDDFFIKSIKGIREFFDRSYIKDITSW